MKSIKIAKLSVRPAFVFTLFAFIFAESSVFSLCVIICAVFHELGHFFAIKAFRQSIASLELSPFGAVIRYGGTLCYKKEILIALAGPCFSLLLTACLMPFYLLFPCPILLFLCICSLFLGLFNLIPLRSFDGGRVLRGIFFSAFEYEKALMLSRASELLALLILSAVSVWTVIFSSYNLSLCFICAYVFVSVYLRES